MPQHEIPSILDDIRYLLAALIAKAILPNEMSAKQQHASLKYARAIAKDFEDRHKKAEPPNESP